MQKMLTKHTNLRHVVFETFYYVVHTSKKYFLYARCVSHFNCKSAVKIQNGILTLVQNTRIDHAKEISNM